MHYSGEKLREISFPVGGIGAGCVGVAGDGRLVDWEIFNEAGKGRRNGFTHFAVRAEENGAVLDARVLNGDLTHDLQGERLTPHAMFQGYGWGPEGSGMPGLPHFRTTEFTGEFPICRVDFRDNPARGDRVFPAAVSLTAWSPFVPGDSDLSSTPAAVFELGLENTSGRTLDYTCVGVVENPWRTGARNAVRARGGMTCLSLESGLPAEDIARGELALTTDAENVSFQESWYRGGWSDCIEVYWHDLMLGGRFKNRRYDTPWENDRGLLAAHVRLAPGERRRVTFVLSWYVPERKNDWDRDADRLAADAGLPRGNRWRNYYATLFTGAEDAAARLWDDLAGIRGRVFAFRDALHSTTVPEAVLDGAASNLSVLVSPTVLRLEDGTFWAWEGVGPRRGSCHGTCQHVWGYEQALPDLFPDLSRSIRESHAKYGFRENGEWAFRITLPLGAAPREMPPCADGAFGEVMRVYRDWKICGDAAWLRKMWPAVRRVVEYSWRGDTRFRWDPERSGVLTGRCHHTLDMELFGPHGWLQGIYLGALKAAALMADEVGETDFAGECRAVFGRGRAWTEENLFNGKYYIQKIDLSDGSVLDRFESARKIYWDEEHGEIKYQIGEGCEIDAHLGQLFATLCGLGEVLDAGHIRSTLDAIFENNFKPSLRDFANTWRVFAANDESATLMCAWPEGTRKPVLPIPYNAEAMTGFEWAFATHLVLAGETEKGARVAAAVRGRFDGAARNPYNEFECGSNYARSLAAFGMLRAYSGQRRDPVDGKPAFAPAVPGPFRTFWADNGRWGVYERAADGSETVRELSGGSGAV